MDIHVDKAALLQGLYMAQGIADRKSTMPILANVLLRSDGKDKVLVAATDLNTTLTAEIPCKVDKEGGVTVAAKHLHDIVKSLPGENMRLRRTDNNYAEIKAGKVNYKVVGMSDRDFPKLPNHREVKFGKVDGPTLRDMIAKTFFSISTDETRYHLNGVLFECDGKTARMVSTDGHRLSKIERHLEGGPKLAQGVIIPRKGLVELRRALESSDGAVELGFHAGHVFLRSEGIALSIKLIDAQFPPYDQVIPKENEKVAICARLQLLEALRRISLMSSDKTWGIRFSFGKKNALELSSDNPDLGEAHEDVDVSYNGGPLKIGFNAKYFIELLSEMDGDEVRLELNGELDPGVVTPQPAAPAKGKGKDVEDKSARAYLGVIMPMKL